MTVEIVHVTDTGKQAVLRASCRRCPSEREQEADWISYMHPTERARRVQAFIDTLEIEGWVMAPHCLCPACVPGGEN